MDLIKNIDQIFDVPSLELRKEIKELLNKELCLGMTRYVCRYGTLGDGFEKFTDSQKYYQSLKEIYSRSCELVRLNANAKKAQATYIRAKERLEKAEGLADKIEAQADMDLADLTIFEQLTSAEDLKRQLDEFNKIRLELKDKVQAEFPEGIEQAEQSNWEKVAQYRSIRSAHNLKAEFQSLPFSAEKKFQLGLSIANPQSRMEMLAPLVVKDEKQAMALTEHLKGEENVK